ncbi:hypothetical protein SAMN05216534_0196 [Candidatus Aquiluna sp. UB-MaderosW2red]|nr:hypothetical protein SAMN05216534_0196 [Candidatus Aquiluna sp. UB-MaderosW2red]
MESFKISAGSSSATINIAGSALRSLVLVSHSVIPEPAA